MARRKFVLLTKADFRTKLVSLLTQSDAQDYPNMYRLSLYLEAANGMMRDVEKHGVSKERAFAEHFNPTRDMVRIAKLLKLDIKSDRGRWVAANPPLKWHRKQEDVALKQHKGAMTKLGGKFYEGKVAAQQDSIRKEWSMQKRKKNPMKYFIEVSGKVVSKHASKDVAKMKAKEWRKYSGRGTPVQVTKRYDVSSNPSKDKRRRNTNPMGRR